MHRFLTTIRKKKIRTIIQFYKKIKLWQQKCLRRSNLIYHCKMLQTWYATMLYRGCWYTGLLILRNWPINLWVCLSVSNIHSGLRYVNCHSLPWMKLAVAISLSITICCFNQRDKKKRWESFSNKQSIKQRMKYFSDQLNLYFEQIKLIPF